MKHRASHAFWNLYDALPVEVREQADKAFALLKENPQHRSLHSRRSKELLTNGAFESDHNIAR